MAVYTRALTQVNDSIRAYSAAFAHPGRPAAAPTRPPCAALPQLKRLVGSLRRVHHAAAIATHPF